MSPAHCRTKQTTSQIRSNSSPVEAVKKRAEWRLSTILVANILCGGGQRLIIVNKINVAIKRE